MLGPFRQASSRGSSRGRGVAPKLGEGAWRTVWAVASWFAKSPPAPKGRNDPIQGVGSVLVESTCKQVLDRRIHRPIISERVYLSAVIYPSPVEWMPHAGETRLSSQSRCRNSRAHGSAGDVRLGTLILQYGCVVSLRNFESKPNREVCVRTPVLQPACRLLFFDSPPSTCGCRVRRGKRVRRHCCGGPRKEPRKRPALRTAHALLKYRQDNTCLANGRKSLPAI